MGVRVEWFDDCVVIYGVLLKGVDMDMNYILDVVMMIVVVVLFVEGEICICNIYNWWVKEIDCLNVMVIELCKLGVEVEEGYDFICVMLVILLKYVEIDIYNDYCIVMCFLLVSLSDILVIINDLGCIVKIFFDYFM